MFVAAMLALSMVPSPTIAAGTPPVAPLLPEGSVISSASGTMVRPRPGDPWHFRVRSTRADATTPVRDLVLMPSRALEDMERTQANHGPGAVMVVTGDVTVFDGRNWLLPRHVELLAAPAVRQVPTEVPADPSIDQDDSLDDGMRSGATAGDSIADIVADLQDSVELLPRSVDDGTTTDMTEEVIPDGTLILSRRGRLMRGHHGAWVFVFDADVWGTSDAPVVLLPSPTLTKLIKDGRRADYREPIQISGSLSTYRGRAFLVPTAYSTLYQRKNLSR